MTIPSVKPLNPRQPRRIHPEANTQSTASVLDDGTTLQVVEVPLNGPPSVGPQTATLDSHLHGDRLGRETQGMYITDRVIIVNPHCLPPPARPLPIVRPTGSRHKLQKPSLRWNATLGLLPCTVYTPGVETSSSVAPPPAPILPSIASVASPPAPVVPSVFECCPALPHCGICECYTAPSG